MLSQPELVLAELQRKEQEANATNFLQSDLERVKTQLANRQKQKSRIWRAFALTGDEEKFKRDIGMLNSEVKALEDELLHLEERIKHAERFHSSVTDIKRACQLIKRNLGSLSFEDKRLALEALQIKVWVDDSNVNIEGVIPIPEGQIMSMPS